MLRSCLFRWNKEKPGKGRVNAYLSIRLQFPFPNPKARRHRVDLPMTLVNGFAYMMVMLMEDFDFKGLLDCIRYTVARSSRLYTH